VGVAVDGECFPIDATSAAAFPGSVAISTSGAA